RYNHTIDFLRRIHVREVKNYNPFSMLAEDLPNRLATNVASAIYLPFIGERIKSGKIKYAMLAGMLARHKRCPRRCGDWRYHGLELCANRGGHELAQIRHVTLRDERPENVERCAV